MKCRVFLKGSQPLFSRYKDADCPLNQGALNTYSQDSFQPSPCLQTTLNQSKTLGDSGDSDPGHCMKENKNEGMLVCIVHGATVLISRREKLNSVVLDVFAP
jgi:hypothetical protein